MTNKLAGFTAVMLMSALSALSSAPAHAGDAALEDTPEAVHTFSPHLTSAPEVKEGEKPPEVAIVSVFGKEPLQVYDLPFKDRYPTGPFERLENNRFLFISNCGAVYFTVLENELKLTRPASHLTKPMPDGDAAEGSNIVYCKELSGVKDSLLVGDSLFVVYSFWDEKDNGVRLALSEFKLDAANSTLEFKREIYLSQPAIKEPILGHQVGGKLAMGEDEHTLFLSIGDFSKPDRVQDPNTSLGKVMRINLQNLNAEVYAIGVRSPSGGLYYDKETEELWLSDHGPRGGDEINLIQKGRNYGWPIVSYGTIYERDGMGNYYGNKFNSHEKYEKPAMVFLPSIGVGPIAKYPATGKNEYWENDYFVAGMSSMNLLRIRKEGTRLVYAEPVLSGYRIRDIKIDQQGNFYMKTDHNKFLLTDPNPEPE